MLCFCCWVRSGCLGVVISVCFAVVAYCVLFCWVDVFVFCLCGLIVNSMGCDLLWLLSGLCSSYNLLYVWLRFDVCLCFLVACGCLWFTVCGLIFNSVVIGLWVLYILCLLLGGLLVVRFCSLLLVSVLLPLCWFIVVFSSLLVLMFGWVLSLAVWWV